MVASGSWTLLHRPGFGSHWSSRSINKICLVLARPLFQVLPQRLGPCSLLKLSFTVSCQSCWTLSTASTTLCGHVLLACWNILTLGWGLLACPMLRATGLWPVLVSFRHSALDSTPNISPMSAAGWLPNSNTTMVAKSHSWLCPAYFSVHTPLGHICLHSENLSNAGCSTT